MTTSVRTGVAAAARCLALDQAAATTVRALHEAQVPSIVLKGAGLAARLYADDPSRRRYSDVDLLVSPTDFARAELALSRLGYRDGTAGMRSQEWSWHERSWMSPGLEPLTIDLHRGFAGVGDPVAFWEALALGREPLRLGGELVSVPDATCCALVVALHAATTGSVRKEVTDLVNALDCLGSTEWEAAARMARRTDSLAAFVAGLQRVPEGVALVARLGLAPHPTPLRALATRLGLASATRAMSKLADAPDGRARLRQVRTRLAPSPAYMRRSSPIASRGPGGLVAAYLARPFRLMRPFPGAADQLRVLRKQPEVHQRRPATVAGRRLRASVRTARRLGWSEAQTGAWAWWGLHRVRRQLVCGPLDAVRLSAGPIGGSREQRVVRQVLSKAGASCLEESLVLQRWHATQREPVDLIISVTHPGHGFHAHARLAGDCDPLDAAGANELLRRPTPPQWLTSP